MFCFVLISTGRLYSNLTQMFHIAEMCMWPLMYSHRTLPQHGTELSQFTQTCDTTI